MAKMRVLVACEFTQAVTKAMRDRGHEAYSNDLLPTEGNPEWYLQGDVRDYLDLGWDMLIAFDPCTYQCNSGVRWLRERPERWKLLEESCELTKAIFDAPIPLKARENPVPHRYALALIGRRYDQLVHPHYFGDSESKATCLWLFGLSKLRRTHYLSSSEIKQSVFRCPPSVDRGLIRSRTFPGIARAMAEQWG